MIDLIVRENNLPANLEDLSKFVLVGDEKIKADRAQISALKKLGVAQEVVKIKLHDAQITAEQVTFAKIKLGELLNSLPKATKGNGSNQFQQKNAEIDTSGEFSKPKAESIAELGITQKQAERLQQMAKNQDAVQLAMAKARRFNKVQQAARKPFFLLIQFEKVAILIKKSRRQEKFRAEYIEFVVEVHLPLIRRISVFLACHGAKKRRKKLQSAVFQSC